MSGFVLGNASRIRELDGLRAFAVLMVVFYHVVHFSKLVFSEIKWIENLSGYLGPSGVHVFFVISGYVITTLLIREKESKGRVSVRGFYLRRIFRILPPLLLYLLCLNVLCRIGWIDLPGKNFAYSLLFMSNLGLLSPDSWWVAHTWSLSVEEQFYIVFPFFFCLLLKYHRVKMKICLITLFLLSLVSLKIASELVGRFGDGWIWVAGFYKFRYIIVGVWFALSDSLRSKMRRLPATRLFPFLLFLLSYSFHSLPFPTKVSVALQALDPILCAVFVFWFIVHPKHCSITRHPVSQWGGTRSYSIYLWQQLFTAPGTAYLSWNIGASFLAMPLLFSIAEVSYRFIEVPAIRMGRQLSSRFSS